MPTRQDGGHERRRSNSPGRFNQPRPWYAGSGRHRSPEAHDRTDYPDSAERRESGFGARDSPGRFNQPWPRYARNSPGRSNQPRPRYAGGGRTQSPDTYDRDDFPRPAERGRFAHGGDARKRFCSPGRSNEPRPRYSERDRSPERQARGWKSPPRRQGSAAQDEDRLSRPNSGRETSNPRPRNERRELDRGQDNASHGDRGHARQLWKPEGRDQRGKPEPAQRPEGGHPKEGGGSRTVDRPLHPPAAADGQRWERGTDAQGHQT